MKAEIAAAERLKEVRDAARAWRRAGFATDEVLARVVTTFPDNRVRFGPGFRVLAFILTGIAVWAVVAVSLLLLPPSAGGSGWGTLFIVWATVLFATTEFLMGPLRRAEAGMESATAYSSVAFAVFGVIALTDSLVGDASHEFWTVFLASSFGLCVLAAWRWGDRVLFAGAAVAGFGLLTQVRFGRLLWILAALVLIPACLKAARDARLPPSHRSGAWIVSGVAVLALYGAVHVWSFDERFIEGMFSQDAAQLPFRSLSILATALLPPLLLILGWRRREPLLLYSGLLLIGVSIATIRLYRAVMPLSFALILVGTGCLVLGLGVRRWLRSGPAGEREGFTADPLFDNKNRTDAIRSVVAVATFTPAAQAVPARPAFQGGGGSFGGGGASGDY